MMTTRISYGLHLVLVVFLLNAAGMFLSVGNAQVKTDITTSGLGTTVRQTGPTWHITGGTQKGSNLFHSFGSLNVGPADTANFCNAAACGVAQPLGGIQNILGRVTGGQVSNIFGTIQTTTFGTANLFLMNPAGWIFGPTARLNVGGSFHVTTADYIRLEDGSRFNAVPSGADTLLTVAAPAAFGFLTSNPAGIDVKSGVFPMPGLQVPVSKTLSLVGGPVNVGAPSGQSPVAVGFVLAPGGVVNIASVASPGEATFAGGINVDAFAKLGEIHIIGGAVVDGREINIRGGRLEITDATLIPGISSLTLPGAPAPNGGQVSIHVTDDVTITGTGRIFSGQGQPGIQTAAGFPLSPSVPFGSGDVPSINIKAGSLFMTGRAGIQTNRFGPGNPPAVVITADTIEVRNGAVIGMSNSFGGGASPAGGGTLTINGNNMTLSSDGSTPFTGISANPIFNMFFGSRPDAFSPFFQFAGAPAVTINLTGTLTVRGNAKITTDSSSFGPAGDINVNAANILLVGAGPGTGQVSAQGGIVGQSGSIRLNATVKIDVQNGFQISAGAGGSGNGGMVALTAGESITLGTNSRISSGTSPLQDQELNSFAQRFARFFGIPSFNYASLRTALGIAPGPGDLMQVLARLSEIRDSAGNPLVAVTDFTPGDAGRIVITTPLLAMNANARIETSTGWGGNAGAVGANVNSLFLNDGAAIRSLSGIELLNGQLSVGAGNAGGISLAASDAISISNSTLSTTTFGNGNAGSISLSANQVNVQNGSSVTSESGGTLAGRFFAGSGNAGLITVSTPTLTMADGSVISVKTSGGGNAPGNIFLNVGNFTQAGGARIDSSTLGAGRGGDLTVTVANSASIAGPGTGLFSTASGSGAGGNIKIQAGKLVQLTNDATISAQSTGTATATAGDININTPTFQSQNSSVTTGAKLADGGNISITTTGSLVRLTDSQVTTSVQGGVGNGGNIAIDSKLIVVNDSQILAQAVLGHGGNINITGDIFIVNSGGRVPVSLAGIVDASSELSTPGTIDIEATFTNVTGTFAQLPSTPLQASQLLRASCPARFAGAKASSLVVGGRDGLPLEPGDLLPSPLYVTGPSSGDNGLTAEETPLRVTLLDSKDRLLNKYSLLPNAKCSL